MNTVTTRGPPSNEPANPNPSAFPAAPLRFNLSEHVKRLQRDADYLEHGRIAGALLLRSELRLIVVALRGGVRIPAHDTTQPTTVQGLQGKVRFHCSSGVLELEAGSLLVLERDVLREIEALEESALLFSLVQLKDER